MEKVKAELAQRGTVGALLGLCNGHAEKNRRALFLITTPQQQRDMKRTYTRTPHMLAPLVDIGAKLSSTLH